MGGTQRYDAAHRGLTEFVARHLGATPIELQLRPLRGGLMADSVVHVVATCSAADGTKRRHDFVVKRLPAASAREAAVYQNLPSAIADALAPRLLAIDCRAVEFVDLYLEAVARAHRWPWPDVRLAAAVLERLAELHTSDHASLGALAERTWDYDGELRERAADTLARAERFAAEQRDRIVGWSLPALRRVVRDLGAIRDSLARLPELPPTVLHGDVHPGNVLVRRHNGELAPVLLDWGRVRVGSPLEDVSSWLQSLGFWEPAVRRKHDTLLRAYLEARGLRGHPSRAVRDAYWLAAACNGLAGALAHHLERAELARPGSRARAAALASAHDALRVVRRADACRRPTPGKAPAVAAA